MKQHKSENLKCPWCNYEHSDLVVDFVTAKSANTKYSITHESCDNCDAEIDIEYIGDDYFEIAKGE